MLFSENQKLSIDRILFGSEISVIHDFHRPPYGGGNQFLLALRNAWVEIGQDVGANRVGRNTKFILFNSYNFDFDRLRKKRTSSIRMTHRVDGPIGVYRGTDTDIDNRILKINEELADATVFQSFYSLNRHIELGLNFKNPVVIPNSVNPTIFNSLNKVKFPEDGSRKVRIVASSWSNNIRKGQKIYEWLDDNLDFTRFDFTFVGRTQGRFKNIATISALPSVDLARILKLNDIYITGSENDPCSNALLEGLACGLPSIYLNSGGHPELVGGGGLPFQNAEEIPGLLDELCNNYSFYKERISLRSMKNIALEYLDVVKGKKKY